jgi:hypothetical protein
MGVTADIGFYCMREETAVDHFKIIFQQMLGETGEYYRKLGLDS